MWCFACKWQDLWQETVQMEVVNSHECMVDECPSSRSFQDVVQTVLQLSAAFAGGGRVGPGSGRTGQGGAQQTCAVRRVPALRCGRLAPLRVDGGQSHELYPPVVVRSRGHQHSDATVIRRTSQHLSHWRDSKQLHMMWHFLFLFFFSVDHPRERTAKFGLSHSPVRLTSVGH